MTLLYFTNHLRINRRMAELTRCKGITKSGFRCKKTYKAKKEYCHLHENFGLKFGKLPTTDKYKSMVEYRKNLEQEIKDLTKLLELITVKIKVESKELLEIIDEDL